MKKKRNYLIIPVTDLSKRDDPNLDVATFFKNNYVPTIHRYIVLKVSNIDIFKESYAIELLTHVGFQFNASIVKTILNPESNKEIIALSNNIMIKTCPKLVTISEVREFYREIISHNEAKDYRESVKELLLSNKKKTFPEGKVKIRRINH